MLLTLLLHAAFLSPLYALLFVRLSFSIRFQCSFILIFRVYAFIFETDTRVHTHTHMGTPNTWNVFDAYICMRVCVCMYWVKCALCTILWRKHCVGRKIARFIEYGPLSGVMDERERERERNHRRGHSIESTQCTPICIATTCYTYLIEYFSVAIEFELSPH